MGAISQSCAGKHCKKPDVDSYVLVLELMSWLCLVTRMNVAWASASLRICRRQGCILECAGTSEDRSVEAGPPESNLVDGSDRVAGFPRKYHNKSVLCSCQEDSQQM